jgi:anti-sigma B factor antagonist
MTHFRLDIPGPRRGEGDGPPALQVVARDVTDTLAVVEVRGDLDLMTAPRFDGWVRDLLGGRADVVLDLDGVAFIASAGIAVLMGLRLDTAGGDTRLHLTGRRNRAVSRPLEVLGLAGVLDLQDDTRAVVAELVPTA